MAWDDNYNRNVLSQIQYKWTSFNPYEMYTYEQIFVVEFEEYRAVFHHNKPTILNHF